MQSDSAHSSGSPSDPGGAPAEETSPKPAPQATVAASLSSFRGLVGASNDSAAGSASNASADSTIGTSGPVRLEAALATGVGQTIGRYHIKKVLGTGSMGSVFLAHDSQLNREVALKVPRLERDTAGELSQRLHREALAAAKLSHPNICPIYDVTDQAGSCFIAMGYIPGKPLSAYLGKKVQPEREVAKVVRKIALALEEAHAQGIVHRDLKPSNIMIDKRGEPIVMDFGVACWLDDQAQTRLTQQGSLVGTPSYMSPEQIEGKTKVGPSSDIYSLGVVLYELLTGRCPFQGTVLNVISQVLHQAPPDPRKLRRDLSPELIAIVNRAMQKNPADRFASMRDFAKALTGFLNGPSREGAARETLVDDEALVAESPKLERIKHQPLPTALPPRKRVPAKKKKTSGIPVGYGVVAATLLVVVGALLGAFVVGKRPSSTVAAVDEHSVRTAESSPAVGALADSSPAAEPAAQVTAATKDEPRAQTSPSGPSQARPKLARLAKPEPTTVASPPANPAELKSGAAAPTSPPSSGPQVGASAAAGGKPASSTVGTARVAQNDPTPHPTDNRASSPPVNPGATPPNDRRPGPPAPPASDPQEMSDPGPPRDQARPDGRDDGPPPGQGPPRRAPFDGGPKRGMSIEQYFKKLDTSHDNRIDPTELPLHIINRADTDKDGELTLNELKKAFKRLGQRLFGPPTTAERRRLPSGGPPPGDDPPPGSPGRPGSGGQPARGNGGL